VIDHGCQYTVTLVIDHGCQYTVTLVIDHDSTQVTNGRVDQHHIVP
jgi:hypothetical protein